MPKVIMIIVTLLVLQQQLKAQRTGTIRVTEPDIPAERIKASIARKTAGYMPKKRLLASEIIEVNDTTKVISYDFEMTYASLKTRLTVQGNQLTPEIKQYVDKARSQQIIHFKNILCRDKNGLMFRLMDMQFEILN
ncbi:MAG: hypothetical protein JKX74_05320 [Flavobacteriales bacterium]|nr:hypothetical protein [Flavobacteriales bacterium]